ncbi:MAG TPA: amidohydrolase family protein [Terracidiphilus sp.]|nr:amidohydrolase family protein [Terracidiphilus sp.]
MNLNALISPAVGERRIWLRVGTLVDGVSTAPVHRANVVYDSKGILFAGADLPPRDLLRATRTEPDHELPQFTLLPGLTDAHTHHFLEGGELDPDKRTEFLKQTPAQLTEHARRRLEKLVRLGVTATRDCGDKDGVGLALSRLNESADRPHMPYVDSPGAAIHHRGRYGSFMAEPFEDCLTARQCVEARVKAGADRIKLIPTGIINFKKGAVTAAPQMSAERIAEFVAAAKEFGKQTMAHASGDRGIENVIEGGVDSIEHGFFVRDDQLAEMRDKQIAWVPTFAPVQRQVDHADWMGWDAEIVGNLRKILDAHAASLVKAHAMGVQVIAGADAGSYGVAHGLGLLYELELMQRAGLSPLAVINSATGAGSKRLAFKEKFGQIKAGFRSRFIIAHHSPLEDVGNLRKEKIVVFDGAVFAGGGDVDATGL